VTRAPGPSTSDATTWLHEYVHARQGFRAVDRLAWLTEASAEYYGDLPAYRTGAVEYRIPPGDHRDRRDRRRGADRSRHVAGGRGLREGRPAARRAGRPDQAGDEREPVAPVGDLSAERRGEPGVQHARRGQRGRDGPRPRAPSGPVRPVRRGRRDGRRPAGRRLAGPVRPDRATPPVPRERTVHERPVYADTDGDDVPDRIERELGTDPDPPDTDGAESATAR
jgi:hypothetical protein